jgi:hypothetical protein
LALDSRARSHSRPRRTATPSHSFRRAPNTRRISTLTSSRLARGPRPVCARSVCMWRTEARPSHTDPGCTSIDGLRDSQCSSSSPCTRQAHALPMHRSPHPTNASHHREEKRRQTRVLPSSTALILEVQSATRCHASQLASLPDADGRLVRRVYWTQGARVVPDTHGSRAMSSRGCTLHRERLVCLCFCSLRACATPL